MREDDLAPLLERGGRRGAPGEERRGAAEDPRVGQRGAPDHDGVAAGPLQHRDRVPGLPHVAVADDRDGEALLEPADLAPVRRTAEHLPGRAGVQRDGGHAEVLADPPELEEVDRLRPPAEAEPELHGERDVEDPAAGLDDARCAAEVAHEGRARATLQHLVRRAAHVDVADVGPQLVDQRRALGHPPGVAAVDLDREGPLFLPELHLAQHRPDAARDGLAGDELHRHEADAADPADEQPEVAVADAGHRREHQRRRDLERPDLERRRVHLRETAALSGSPRARTRARPEHARSPRARPCRGSRRGAA